MTRLGLMGGTFNPPHYGHLHAASCAREDLQLDRVLFIPTNLPPHKQLPAGSATAAQRCEMVRLLTQGLPWAELSDIEIERGGASYTIDTLRQLTAPDRHLFLIIGTDMLLSFDRVWRSAGEICRLCTLAAYARDADEQQLLNEKKHSIEQKFQADVRVMERAPFPVSSTEIRSGGDLERLVPPAVAEYIRKNQLYDRKNF